MAERLLWEQEVVGSNPTSPIMNKKKAQRKHAKRRFHKRFGLNLSKALRSEIINIIQAGKATPVKRQSLRIGLFEICIRGKKIIVVYDKNSKEIVSGWLL